VAGALPVTPAGLGVVDSLTPLLLVSFGVTRSVATLGVLAWRLVNFWLPIPTGAIAYVSLKVPRGARLKAARAAVTSMMTRPGAPDAPPGNPQDVAPPGGPQDVAPPGDPQDVAPPGDPQDVAPPGDPQDIAPDAETTDRSAP
jgi:hypothetical protein